MGADQFLSADSGVSEPGGPNASDVRALAIVEADDIGAFWRELPLANVRESPFYEQYLNIVNDPRWRIDKGENRDELQSPAVDEPSTFHWLTDWIDRTGPGPMALVVFESGSGKSPQWYLTLEFDQFTTRDMKALLTRLAPRDERSDRKETELSEPARDVPDEQNIEGLATYSLGKRWPQVRWAVDENVLRMASSESAFRTGFRVTDPNQSGVFETRRFKRLRGALDDRTTGQGKRGRVIGIADFELLTPWLGKIPPQIVRTLGVNEIVGVGAAIDIDNQGSDGSTTIRLKAVGLTTLPKNGVARVLDSLQPIDVKTLPPIADNTSFLGVINFSPTELYDGMVDLYDTIFEEGAFLRDYHNASPIGQPEFELREDLCQAIDGTMLSYNFMDHQTGYPRRFSGYRVASTEKMEKVVSEIVAFLAPRARERKLERTTLLGHTSWFSATDKFQDFARAISGDAEPAPIANTGYVLVDEWLYFGEKSFVESMLSGQMDQQVKRRDQLDQMWSHFQREVGSPPEFAIVFWSDFLDNLADRTFYRDIERLYPDRDERYRVIKRLARPDGGYPEPKNRRQAMVLANVCLQRAMTSLLDHALVAGVSNGSGMELYARAVVSPPAK